ncbi:MAG: FHA domain-containing protein [Myxococcaceae bacterium]
MSSLQLLAQLGLVCPSCDHFNPAGATKCINDGTALTEGGPAPAAKPVAPPPQQPARPSAAQVPPRMTPSSGGTALGDAPVAATDSFARPGAGRPASNPGMAAPRMGQAMPGTLPTPPPVSPSRAPPAAAPQPPNLRPSARPPTATPSGTPAPIVPPQQKPAAPQQPPAQARPAPVHAFDAKPAAGAPTEPIPATDLLKKPTPKPPAPAASTNAARFALVVVGGSAQGQRFRLAGAGFVLGRSRGAILFPDDPFISAHHATFTVRDGRLFVRDENSASGIYVTIHGQEPLSAQACFSVANRCFRYTGSIEPVAPQPGRPTVYGAPVPAAQALFGVEELLVGGRPGKAVVTAAPLLTIGSSKCDLSYPSDEGLAPRHCELSPQPPSAMLRDLSGGLGTFIRIAPAADRMLTPGDRVRVGEQILQVEAIA